MRSGKTAPRAMSAIIVVINVFLFVILQSDAQDTHPPSTLSLPATGDGAVQVSKSDPRYFELGNHQTFIPIGPNICFPRFETEEESVFALYEEQFRKLHDNGGNYTRIFLGAPFWEVESEYAGQYNPKVAARLIRLLKLADQYQIKIKFCLEHFRKIKPQPSRTNNLIPFEKPVYSKECGGPLTDFPEFFTTEKGQHLYLSRTKFLADLLRDSSQQIFAWELWNEINAVGTNCNYIVWTETMLEKLHALFPQNMVVQNMGSFDNDGVRETYRSIMTMPGNDYAQIHRYLDPAAKLEMCRGPIDLLAADAVQELRKYVDNRPVLLSEVGAVEFRHAGPSVLYERDMEGTILHDSLFAPFFSGAAGPGEPWHWTYYIDKNNLWWHFDRFAEAIKNFDPVAEGVVPVRLDQQHFRVYVLKGSHTVLIWLRDIDTNWKTELVDNIKAPVNQGITFDCWPMPAEENTKVSVYDPWTDKWTQSELTNGKIPLPPFTRSLVIKIENL